MFIQALIYLPHKIKRDRHQRSPILVENCNFQKVWQISTVKITAKSFSWVVNQAPHLQQYICWCLCVLCLCPLFFFFFKDGWLVKYQSVLFASMKLHNIKVFPPHSHKNPGTLGFFLTHACLPSQLCSKKGKTPLMILDARRRDCCQQNKEKNTTSKQTHFRRWLTSQHLFIIPVMLVQICCCQKVWPHTSADAAIWCCSPLCLPTTWLKDT